MSLFNHPVVKGTIFFILLLTVLILLSGCQTTEYRLIERTQYVYIPIGKEHTQVILPKRPPDRDLYVKSTYQERAGLFRNYAADLLKTTADLNNRLKGIEKIDTEHRTLVESYNAKEDARVEALTGKTVKELRNRN